jgi:hypothetical protein
MSALRQKRPFGTVVYKAYYLVAALSLYDPRTLVFGGLA